MTNGNIWYARFPIDSDANAPADTVKISPMPTVLFDTLTFDSMSCQVVRIGGNNGVFKNVVLIMARNK